MPMDGLGLKLTCTTYKQQNTAADPTIAIYDMDGTARGSNSTSSTSSSAGGGRKRGRVCMELAGHTHGVSDVAWARDSRLLASASDDKSVRLWDTETVRVWYGVWWVSGVVVSFFGARSPPKAATTMSRVDPDITSTPNAQPNHRRARR